MHVDLVRTISNADGAGAGILFREHGILANSQSTVKLYSPVYNRLGHLRRDYLDHPDKVPGFLVSGAIALIRSTIKGKASFDIDKLNPIGHVKECFIPALFAHG